MLGNFSKQLLPSDFFFITRNKVYQQNFQDHLCYLQATNSGFLILRPLDPDYALQNAWPDLDPLSCFQVTMRKHLKTKS